MKEWKYLWTEPFKARYAVAAYFLKDCPFILEIGGYKTPISDFVCNKTVHVVDPRTDKKHEGNIHHFPIMLKEYPHTPPQPYGLVILGLELHLYEEEWQRIFDLVRNAATVVIETPIEHPTSVDQFNKILQNTNRPIKHTIKLDLSQNDFSDLEDTAPPKCIRVVYIL